MMFTCLIRQSVVIEDGTDTPTYMSPDSPVINISAVHFKGSLVIETLQYHVHTDRCHLVCIHA